MTRLALLVAATFFMEFLDATILTTALPKMAQSLGVPAVSLSVGVSIYALTLAIFILPSAWAAERYGARVVYTGAIALFTVSSALCAFSTAAWFFIAARALQGVGGAFMVPVGRLVVLRSTPPSGILRAAALLTWPGLTAPLIGPALGGFLAENLSWRAIFLVNLPLGLIGAIFAAAWTPALERDESKPFDFGGFVLAAIALGASLLALDAEGVRAAELALVAAAAAWGFWRYERWAAHPIVDFSPFRRLTFRLSLTGGTAARIIISSVPFLAPLMFQLGLGFNAAAAGLTVTPLFLGNLGIKPFTTAILRRWGFRRVLIVNAALQAATLFGCAAIGQGVPAVAIGVLLCVSGASRSMHFTALSTLPFVETPASEMGMANLIFSVSFQASFAFGVGVAAALLKVGGLVAAAPLGPFRFALIALGLGMLAVMLNHARLAANAGAAATQRADA